MVFVASFILNIFLSIQERKSMEKSNVGLCPDQCPGLVMVEHPIKPVEKSC